MKMQLLVPAVLLALLASIPCGAEVTWTYIEDFEGSLATVAWRMGAGDEIVPAGGNPGAFLHDPAALTPLPVVATVSSTPWIYIGFYRIEGVTSLGIDVNVLAMSQEGDGRPISLGLVREMGIPDDPTDDCELVLPGRDMPRPGSGWKSYTFHVPAWKTSMPAKWIARGVCATWPRDDAWNLMMQYVSEARFYVGDPRISYGPETWDIGFDNARITVGKRDAGPTLASGTADPASIVSDLDE